MNSKAGQYNVGYDAFLAGSGLDKCPFEPESREYYEWVDGWFDADSDSSEQYLRDVDIDLFKKYKIEEQ